MIAIRLGSLGASQQYRGHDLEGGTMENTTVAAKMCRRTLLAGSIASALLGNRPVSAADRSQNASMHALINAAARDHSFQGVVVLSRAGRTFYSRAIGMADIARGRPIRVDTPFGIASISKRLTAVAVLRLVEQGKLTLDGPITTWLPWYRADTGARISLRRLLSNSSGVPNRLLLAQKADPRFVAPALSTREAILRFASGDLAFEPGARFDYSASNWFIVLGVIEAATGLSYPDAMQRLVLDPLRLDATTLAPGAVTAKSYRTLVPPEAWPSPRQSYQAAAGGYFSTSGDLLRFARSVYESSFLSPASRKALTTIEVASDGYALGGHIRQVPTGASTVAAAWDTGNTAGFRSILGTRLDGGGEIVVLNNSGLSQRWMDEFADALLKLAT
jgi:D-alanyl-D-alanine carboxypeptidase